MKTIIVSLLFCLVVASTAFCQGDNEWDANGTSTVEGFAPASFTKYSQAAGSTKILIPLTTAMVKWCITPTAASGLRLGITGAQKALAANVEACRTVRKGITQLQYSAATTGTAIFEAQY